MLQKTSAGEPLVVDMNILQGRLSTSFQEPWTVWNPWEMHWEEQNYCSVKGWKFKGVSQNGWGWKEPLEHIRQLLDVIKDKESTTSLGKKFFLIFRQCSYIKYFIQQQNWIKTFPYTQPFPAHPSFPPPMLFRPQFSVGCSYWQSCTM